MRAFLLAGWIAFLPLRGWADPDWAVRTEMLVVRVPEKAGLLLRPLLRETKSISAGLAELRAMIARGEAEFLGAPVVWTANGDRGVSENFGELRYPTEFVVHSVPQNFSSPPPIQIPFTPWSPPPWDVPVAFETRNVGITLELEAKVAPNGKTIEVNIVPQHVTFAGYTRLFAASGSGNDWRYHQPRFTTLKTTTGLTARSGEWQLLNCSVARIPTPAMEFFLLRVTACPAAP